MLGDAVNYAIGYRLGPKVFCTRPTPGSSTASTCCKTQRFYEKYGGKTIILARFVPIIRTFAPFVAGVGRMSYPRFAMFNVTGAVAWVAVFLFGGYLFGNLPVVTENFHW